MKKLTVILGLLCAIMSVYGQTRVVHGKLTAFNRYPLQNIQVMAKKSKAVITSDEYGMFSIVCEKKDIIKITPKAFKPVSKKVGPGTDSLSFNLVFVDSQKNRDIATGYGYISHEDLTFAVSQLSDENNDYCNFSDIYELIEGKVPGVQVQRDGPYGTVIIRGGSSINQSSEALYVVDNIPRDEIHMIDPCEVKSIDVIKDGTAAYYGTRGANGVLIIETKRGGDW